MRCFYFIFLIEILSAKSVLLKCFPNLLGDIQIHRSSVAGLVHEADKIGILDAMKSIDNTRVCTFRFIVGNFDCVLKFGPEKLNFLSVAERIEAVKRELL